MTPGRRPRVFPGLAAAALVLTAAACSGGGQELVAAVTLPVARGTGTLPLGGENVAGVKWDWAGVARYGEFLERFGGGDTFYELVWCDVEATRGHRDWSRIDDVVDAAASYGFRMHLKLRVGSCWATAKRLGARGDKAKTPSMLPSDMDAYREFVRAVVTRYAPRGVHRYAVENEVNLPGFWQSGVSDYEELVRAAAPVIREVDPDATVLDSGVSSTASGAGMAAWLLEQGEGRQALGAYQRYYLRRIQSGRSRIPDVEDTSELEDALRDGQRKRDVEFLDAAFRLAHDGVIDAYQLHFYERWDNVAPLLDFLRHRLPSGFPVEAWEAGIFWPAAPVDEVAIAAETAKTTSLLLAGGVRPVIWLPAAADTGRGGEVRWGLFDPQGRARPGAEVFLRLARAATGARVVPLPGAALDGIALARDGRMDVMTWSSEGTRLDGGLPAGTEVEALDGTPVPWGPAGLRVDGTPLWLAFTGSRESASGSGR